MSQYIKYRNAWIKRYLKKVDQVGINCFTLMFFEYPAGYYWRLKNYETNPKTNRYAAKTSLELQNFESPYSRFVFKLTPDKFEFCD